MTTKAQEVERREAAMRCAHCTRSFVEAGKVVEDVIFPGKFCCEECLEEAKTLSRVERL